MVVGSTKRFDIIIAKHKKKEIIRKFRLSTGHQRPVGTHPSIQSTPVSVVYPSVPLGVTTKIYMTTHFLGLVEAFQLKLAKLFLTEMMLSCMCFPYAGVPVHNYSSLYTDRWIHKKNGNRRYKYLSLGRDNSYFVRKNPLKSSKYWRF